MPNTSDVGLGLARDFKIRGLPKLKKFETTVETSSLAMPDMGGMAPGRMWPLKDRIGSRWIRSGAGRLDSGHGNPYASGMKSGRM